MASVSIEDQIKKSYEESKRVINEAQRDGQLVLFIGAGASIAAGMPSWETAVKKIANNLGINDVSTDDYLRIPQYFYNARDKKEYTQLVQQIFRYRQYLHQMPVHDLIIKFNTQTIITTNYDHLIEQAAESNSEMIRVISKDTDLPYHKGGRELIKMHGDFENDNFVLKEEDYLSYSRNFKLIENYIKSIIGTKVVLFIGYSFNDPDVKHIFSWAKDILHGDFQPAYYVCTDDDYSLDAERYFKNLGINVLYSCVQLGKKQNEAFNKTKRLEEMLEWIQKKETKTKLAELHDEIRIYKDFQYPYMKNIEQTLLKYGFFIGNNGYIVSEEFPGWAQNHETIEGLLQRIAREMYDKSKESVYVYNKDGNRLTYSVFPNISVSDTDKENEFIGDIISIIKKTYAKGVAFYVKAGDDFQLAENERDIKGFHRVFVDIEEEEKLPKWSEAAELFDDETLKKLLSENNKKLNDNTPELYMEQAAIYSYFEEYLEAYNCLKISSGMFYKRSESVRYYIAETDRYYIGRIIVNNYNLFGISAETAEEIKKEIEVMDLEQTYLSLPDLGKGSEILKDIGSFDISYKMFQDAYSISEKVRNEADTRYTFFGGTSAFSKMRRNVVDFYNFEVQNNIILDRYRENTGIYSLFFQSIFQSALAPDLVSEKINPDEALNIHAEYLTPFEIYVALKYVAYKDIQKLVDGEIRIPVNKECVDYLRKVISCLTARHAWSYDNNTPFWKTVLLMGYIDIDNSAFTEGIKKIADYARGDQIRIYQNTILKFIDNAEKLGVIDRENIEYVSKVLSLALEYLVDVNISESPYLTNYVNYLAHLCNKHECKYDNADEIEKLWTKGAQRLCVEMFLELGEKSESVIKKKFDNWSPQGTQNEYILYCLAVTSKIIEPDDAVEQCIIDYINSEKNRFEKGKQNNSATIQTFGQNEPAYIELMLIMCELNFQRLITDTERLKKTVLEVGDSLSKWLIDMESFDYSEFDIDWLERCSLTLLKDISKSEKAKKGITRKIQSAYKKGRVNKRVLNMFFEHFAYDENN